MSWQDCVKRAVDAGDIDPARARVILEEYDNVFASMRNNMGHTQAQAQTARTVLKAAKTMAAQRRRVSQLQAATAQRNLSRMTTHKNIFNVEDAGAFAKDVVEQRLGARGETLVGRRDVIVGKMRGRMTDAIKAFRSTMFTVRRNKALLDDVATEIFGGSSGNVRARDFARVASGVFEELRTRFNAAGGHIPKRADWGLPQFHDARAIVKAGFEGWRDFILPRLDLVNMIDETTGLPFTARSIEKHLHSSFHAARTDGWTRKKPGNRGSALYNRKADHRFFKFKDAQAWLEYNQEFGRGQDIFRIMMGHIDSMAMDIARMEVLGPNPDLGFQHLIDSAKRIEALRHGPKSKAHGSTETAKSLYARYTGRVNAPRHPGFARFMSATRSSLAAAQLGRAVFSSVTDINAARITKARVGMGHIPSVRAMAKMLASPAMREQASKAGLIFKNGVDIGHAAARFELEEMHVEWASRTAEAVIRSTGLGWITEQRRHLFGLEFMSHAGTDWNSKALGDFDRGTARTFADYGITARDWDLMRTANVHKEGGVEILRAQEIEEVAGQRLADKYQEMILSLTEFAVPTHSMRAKTAILDRVQPGTLIGEIGLSGMQYKMFPVTVLTTHISHVVREAYAGRPAGAIGYLASFSVGATLLGAVAIQLKEISKGKDPRDMTTGKFWTAAAAQGGGLGLFGDFLFDDYNRFGGGLPETLTGPTISLADDVLRLTAGNVQQLMKGERTGAASEAVGFLRRYTPGGSHWALSAAYNREVLDQLEQLVDPRAHRAFRRRMRNARKYDTDFFYKPGQPLLGGGGARLPDFGNAIGR